MPERAYVAGLAVAAILLVSWWWAFGDEGGSEDRYAIDPITRRPRVWDVAGIHSAVVERVLYPLRTDDVARFLKSSHVGPVCMRGTAHSMGGHTLCEGGTQIDLRHLDRLIHIDPQKKIVTVEAGMQWSELIRVANLYGLSPMTLQSYSSFSIGGSISVNAHGITNDLTVASSVLSIKVILANGTSILCTRHQHSDLFRGAIGGFGLFGVIVEATLKLVPNERLELVSTFHSAQSFRSIPLDDPSVGIRITRINLAGESPHDPDSIHLMRFKRHNPPKVCKPRSFIQHKCMKWFSHGLVVSCLGDDASEMGYASRLVYKWLFSLRWMQQFRFWWERWSGKPADWNSDTLFSDRNVLLHESAQGLAQLDRRFIDLLQTHILQEYFVPPNNLITWLELFFEVVLPEIRRQSGLSLLNLTIRFVRQDTLSILAYARSQDMYALVLYFRVGTSAKSITNLRSIHASLTALTQNLGGTFYLPYLHHYHFSDMEHAYTPQRISEFVALKNQVDPRGRFTNQWAAHFLLTQTPSKSSSPTQTVDGQQEGTESVPTQKGTKSVPAQTVDGQQDKEGDKATESVPAQTVDGQQDKEGEKATTQTADGLDKEWEKATESVPTQTADGLEEAPESVPTQTADGQEDEEGGYGEEGEEMRGLVANFRLMAGRGRLGMRDLELFFRRVFVLVPEEEGAAVKERSRWYMEIGQYLPGAKLYAELQAYAEQRLGHGTYRAWRSLKALKRQKKEIVEEVGKLLRHAGAQLPVSDYLSIGDGGRYASALRGANVICGKEVHVHTAEISWIERLAFSPLSSWPQAASASTSQLFSNFSDSNRFLDGAHGSSSFGLVVIAIGLHHFPDELLPTVLDKLQRLVRPGGHLIIREHDAQTELLPLLNVAHSTFNAFTGVTYWEDLREFRHFRSVREWERMLARYRFVPTGLYEVQQHDPTRNTLILFTRDRK